MFPTDEDALKYLVDVRFEYLKQMKVLVLFVWSRFRCDVLYGMRCPCQGFRLVFHFAKNPYFLNSEITKEYYVQNLFIGERYLEKMGG